MATVLTLGRPPPEKWYGQAARTSASALAPFRRRVRAPDRTAARRTGTGLAASAPQRRCDDRRGIDRHHRELKPGRDLRKIDAGRRRHRLVVVRLAARRHLPIPPPLRSEEHTSELQSLAYL